METDGKIIIGTEIDSSNIDDFINSLPEKAKAEIGKTAKEIDKLSQKFGELAGKYFALTDESKGTLVFKIDAKEAEKLKKEIRSVVKEMEKLTGDKVISIKGITDLDDATGKLARNTDTNFKKMGNTIKRFGLSLFGLRSIYTLVSRASSAYLSQDVELAEKLRSVWIGLGSFLAPALEFISNSLLKALGYLNVFIKALTGIDFLARANAKALQKQASAQKEVNNQMYDFDVIRRQQDNSSSGDGGASGSGDLFKIPELDERVVAKLRKLAEWLKKNKDLIEGVGKALLAVFGASAIAKILKNIGSLLGVSGLGGLGSILSTLAQIGIIAIGVTILYTALTGRDLIEDLKNIKIGIDELKKSTETATQAEENHAQKLENLHDKMVEDIEMNKQTDEQRQITTGHLREQTKAIEGQIKELENNELLLDKNRTQERQLASELESVISVYDALYKQNQLNDDETENYMNSIADLILVKKRLGEDTKDLEKKYENLRTQTIKDKDANYELKNSAQAIEDKYKELTGTQWKVKLNSDTGQAESGVTGFVRWLNNLVAKPFTFWMEARETPSSAGSSGAGHGGGGRAFALGGIVTQPTRALIGEAGYPEAVLPMTADYLSTLASEIARYGGGSGGNQPISIYIDGRLIQRQTASRENQRNFITNT